MATLVWRRGLQMGIRQKILVYELQTSEAIVSHWFYLCLSAYFAIGSCFSSLNGFKGQFSILTVLFNLLEPLKNTVLPKKDHSQVLNATKLILNDQGGYSDLSIINSESESFRTYSTNKYVPE